MITLRSISRTYAATAGSFNALRDIDLDVAKGEFVAVVGRSGSGKSTLLNIVGGIDKPTAGTATIAGKNIQDLGESRLAAWRGRNVGFVFQFFQLLPTLTAIENVMMPMDFCGVVAARERRGRATELLDRVGVGQQAHKLPSALSGGEQQRVAIARALANNPPIVLADEPTGNLDSVNAAAVLDLFRSMASSGTTVLIATHDRDVARVIDRTIELADGTLLRVPAATFAKAAGA